LNHETTTEVEEEKEKVREDRGKGGGGGGNKKGGGGGEPIKILGAGQYGCVEEPVTPCANPLTAATTKAEMAAVNAAVAADPHAHRRYLILPPPFLQEINRL
jgi:hypothetical protein